MDNRFKNSFKEDKLQRKELAKRYMAFLNKLEGNHTIALDAPWGSGKTKFIEFLTEELKENKEVFFTYNAWENDYTEEPLLSLMSEFFAIFPAGYKNRKTLKETSINVISNTGKIGITALAKFIINDETIKDIEDEGVKKAVESIINDSSKLTADKLFKTINKGKKSRKQFTENLKESIVSIIKEKNKKCFYIIIDELDRCNPSFSIKLLENIKHLFEIEEIIFIIAVDKTQLAESIKAIYGNGFDSNTYLHRFFDIDLHLPQKRLEEFIENKMEEILNLSMSSEFQELIERLIVALNITLRDFERIFYEVLLLQTFSIKKDEKEQYKIIVLLILKYKINNFFLNLKRDIEYRSIDYIRDYNSQDMATILSKIENFLGITENTKDIRIKNKSNLQKHINLITSTL